MKSNAQLRAAMRAARLELDELERDVTSRHLARPRATGEVATDASGCHVPPSSRDWMVRSISELRASYDGMEARLDELERCQESIRRSIWRACLGGALSVFGGSELARFWERIIGP